MNPEIYELKPLVGLVLGYLFDMDRLSQRAADLGLRERFTLVLNAYAYDEVGRCFDEGLLFSLMDRFEFLSKATRIRATFLEHGAKEFGSLQDLRSAYSQLPPEDRAPFAEATFEREGSVPCYVETEYYNRVGGPMPYHDSYALAFYLAHYDRLEVQRSVLSYCLQEEVEVLELRRGSIVPQTSWGERSRRRWRRLLFWT